VDRTVLKTDRFSMIHYKAQTVPSQKIRTVFRFFQEKTENGWDFGTIQFTLASL
jgi:hypothetical protein